MTTTLIRAKGDPMPKASGLRQKAKLLRQIASIPTWSGYHADRALLAVEKLDHEVATITHYQPLALVDSTKFDA